jgi:hypothetical protein
MSGQIGIPCVGSGSEILPRPYLRGVPNLAVPPRIPSGRDSRRDNPTLRTAYFFSTRPNPTQPDGQNPKPSPRVRTPELVQSSGSDKTWYPSQPVGQNCLSSPARRAKLTVQPTVWEPNPRFLYGPKFGLSARRTSMPVRSNPSDKSPSPSNPPGQKPQPVRPVRTKTPARPTRSGEKGMSNPAQP